MGVLEPSSHDLGPQFNPLLSELRSSISHVNLHRISVGDAALDDRRPIQNLSPRPKHIRLGILPEGCLLVEVIERLDQSPMGKIGAELPLGNLLDQRQCPIEALGQGGAVSFSG